MSGISIWQLVVLFLILLLLFGSKKIKSLGGDLGNSIKSFKNAMNEDKNISAEDNKNDEINAIPEETNSKSKV